MNCRHFTLAILFFFLCGAGLSEAAVKFPTEPSNLTVKSLGVNTFLLKWKDNSKNEVGWEIRVSLKGRPVRFLLVPTANITSYVLILGNSLPGKELNFQLAAYNYDGTTEQLSRPTSTVSVKALSPTTFRAPTKLTATALDDGRIRVAWKDNSTSEHGYQLEYKGTTAPNWIPLGNLQPGTSFSVTTSGYYLPATSYQFRVRAFRENPLEFTEYSEVVKAKTSAFRAPSDLVATPESDGAFSFKWKDRSSIESGFELEKKIGTGAFSSAGTVGANVSSTDPVKTFEFKADYSFRIRAFRLVGAERVYSGYSNTFSIQSTSLARPTALTGVATSDSAITLTWKDLSGRENGYQLSYAAVGGTFSEFKQITTADIKTFMVTKLKPGKSYDFRLRAYRSANIFTGTPVAVSAFITVRVRTMDGIGGDLTPPIFRAASFVYPVEISRESALTSLKVSGLPDGLVYDSSSHTITGTVNAEGVYTVTLKAAFADSPSVTRSLVLRVIRPPAAPVVTQAFASETVVVGATSNVPVNGKFADPDTNSAARIATSLGDIDIILYSIATPQTVDNFLDYVDAGRYDNIFVNRSVSDFVIQTGGFKYTSAAGFTVVPRNAPVQNEPGISNLRGTVAMAKAEGNPNSATSEFFVNMNDTNAPHLDFDNEGFTVFGRVPDSGMTVVDAINDLPIKAYSISPVPSQASSTVPMNAAEAPAIMEPNKLVKITSVTAAPILTYEVQSADPAIATAVLAGTHVAITGVAAGNTTIQVKATDLDGEMVTQDIAVTVP